MEKNKYIFCDFDGVLTAMDSEIGSYYNHDNDKYGISPGCFDRLMKLLETTGAKLVISSNWRNFTDTGAGSVWTRGNLMYQNRLPELRKRLGKFYAGDLIHARHINKAAALRIWFNDNNINPAECSFVIFDDDVKEGFTAVPEFAGHFILTDPETGLSDIDTVDAIDILESEKNQSSAG